MAFKIVSIPNQSTVAPRGKFTVISAPQAQEEPESFLEGITSDPNYLPKESAKGVLKGIGSTLFSVPQNISRMGGAIAGTITEKLAGTGAEESNAKLAELQTKLIQTLRTIPKGDKRRSGIEKLIDHNQEIIGISNAEVAGRDKGITQLETKPDILNPKGIVQEIGYGAEKLAEFFVPSGAVMRANRVINASIDGTKLVSGANNAIKAAELSGKAVPFAAKAIRLGGELTKIGLHTVPEAISAYGVTKAQGGSDEEALTNAKWAAGIVAGFGVVAHGGKTVGNSFQNAARKIYQSALKPSTAKGAPKAKEVVETGLREGIRLTESGILKTVAEIDALESKLGLVIKEAGAKGKKISTASLRPYIEQAKEMLGETVDVAGSKKSGQIIDGLYKNFVKKYGKSVNVELAQELKVNTYQVLKNSYGELANATREGMKQLTRGLKEGIVDVAPQAGNVNARLKALYQFDEALTKAKGRIQNRDLLGLGTKVLASGGSPTGIILAITNHVAGSTFTKSNGAIWLYKLGGLVKSLSPDAIETLAASPTGRKIMERLSGKTITELGPEEQRVAKAITNFLDNPKVGMSIEDVSKTKGAIPPTIYQGETDLTTKFLEYAKGKSTLSKQEIMDFARRPELKKGEADLLNKLAKDLPEGKLPAKEFADSMRRDLLELKSVKVKDDQYFGTSYDARVHSGKNHGKNYEEVVFESPITTNGSSHFPNSKNYFAHTRGDEVLEGGKKIWREQEIQSDALQKDNLENMFPKFDEQGRLVSFTKGRSSMRSEEVAQAKKELGQLSPFTNDRFGERIMRERIKAKAQAGYDKYRLPTGETIGKIEGFESTSWADLSHYVDGDEAIIAGPSDTLIPKDIKVGMRVSQVDNTMGTFSPDDSWIITDILGEGRFKAVRKEGADTFNFKTQKYEPETNIKEILKYAEENPRYKETFDLTGKSNPQAKRYENWGKFLKNKYGGKEVVDPQGNSWFEIDLKKEMGKFPIEAFGVAPIAGGLLAKYKFNVGGKDEKNVVK